MAPAASTVRSEFISEMYEDAVEQLGELGLDEDAVIRTTVLAQIKDLTDEELQQLLERELPKEVLGEDAAIGNVFAAVLSDRWAPQRVKNANRCFAAVKARFTAVRAELPPTKAQPPSHTAPFPAHRGGFGKFSPPRGGV